MKIVIVGAALGGLRTAEALRARGAQGRILLIGDEAGLPYDRPPLSKEMLRGVHKSSGTTLVSREQLTELGVEVRLGVAATRLDLRSCEVTLADGSCIGYDRLVIATGARARQLPGIGQVEGLYTPSAMFLFG